MTWFTRVDYKISTTKLPLARIAAETPATCGDGVVKFDWVMLDDKKINFIEAGVVAESRLGRCWFGGW